MCEVYGYVIAHPEEVIYNAAYCYRARDIYAFQLA